MGNTVHRRTAIALMGGAGAALALGCGGSPTTATDAATTGGTTSGGTASASCAVSPAETEGPFPSLVDVVRSDIREGRPGTPLALTITVVDARNGCAPVSGLTVDVWQCDAAGSYSEYGTQRGETYLRGRQTTNGGGQVTFTTIYPGWYQGRATHIHVEVLRDGASVKVTQIAFPEATNAAVYASGVYASRGRNPTANTRDGIFADSIDQELASVSGSPASGMTATFRVGIAG